METQMAEPGRTISTTVRKTAAPAAPAQLSGIHLPRAAITDGLSSGGRPLNNQVRNEMEVRLGHDFSRVRVHTDDAAHRSAAAVHARAYTVGADIAFQHRHYDPVSAAGRELLAHELAHVVQQRSGPVLGTDAPAEVCVSSPTNRSEHEADRMAGAAMTVSPETQVASRRGAGDATGNGLTHGDQPKYGLGGAAPLWIQRKEVANEGQPMGDRDWTTADRVGNTERWKKACLANLEAADSSQYVTVAERRDFYKWFYEYTAAKGYTTRWALAAHLVARGAQQIADMDVDHETANDVLGLASVELQGFMREGNQVIFDNVLPKLRDLHRGKALTGDAALEWDKRTLAEEQTLVQPMYGRVSSKTVEQLDYIARKKRFAFVGASIGDIARQAGSEVLGWEIDDPDFVNQVRDGKGHLLNKSGTIPEFDQADIKNITDRWQYGMDLGNRFAPEPTGYGPRHTMPAVNIGYTSGAEFARVSTRPNLHQLDAWLNPHRLSRTGAGSDIKAVIARLTDVEKAQIVTDRSPDGWSYSKRFANFLFIDEALIKQALPTDPAFTAAVAEFIARFRQQREQAEAELRRLTSGRHHPM